MPFSSDDALIKRMFASFVARKTRSSGPLVVHTQFSTHPAAYAAHLSYQNLPVPLQPTNAPPGTLRKITTDFRDRTFNATALFAQPHSNHWSSHVLLASKSSNHVSRPLKSRIDFSHQQRHQSLNRPVLSFLHHSSSQGMEDPLPHIYLANTLPSAAPHKYAAAQLAGHSPYFYSV